MLVISLSQRWRKSLPAFLIGLTALSCSANPLFMKVGATPYDHQMSRIAPTLTRARPEMISRVSLTSVNRWMYSLHELPYRYSKWWRTPRELNSIRAGDCKSKALMLYATMRANGAHNMYLVIGKRHVLDSKTHAWLEWETASGTYLLDPTFNWEIEPVLERSSVTYIPFYAYDSASKYRSMYAPEFLATGMSMVSQAPTTK